MAKKKKEEFVRYKQVNFPALNVRSNPSTETGLIITVIAFGRIVEIDKNFEDKYWDHIFAEPNIEGYCMKQYLSPVDPDKLAGYTKRPIVIHSQKQKCDAAEEKENGDGDEEKE